MTIKLTFTHFINPHHSIKQQKNIRRDNRPDALKPAYLQLANINKHDKITGDIGTAVEGVGGNGSGSNSEEQEYKGSGSGSQSQNKVRRPLTKETKSRLGMI